MASLTINENLFIEMMAKSDEHASKGFELVLKRPGFPRFIDAMIEKGFFHPSRNPTPVPSDRDGYVHIPYWKALDYCVVEGLRDVLLGWCESDPCSAKLFVQSLLRNRNEMLRRIGIFVLRRHWMHLKCLYLPILSPELFDIGHLHELYLLLRDRFDTFSEAEKGSDHQFDPESLRSWPRRQRSAPENSVSLAQRTCRHNRRFCLEVAL